MNDEIKEILEHIKLYPEKMYCLSEKEKIKLLDYITNLQQENERLKEENKHIFANVNDDVLLRSDAMNWAEAQDYKSRVEKAVEYINKYFVLGANSDYKRKLTDILNGKGSDE